MREAPLLKPGTVLLYMDDRLGRNIKENLLARIMLDDAGCRVDYAIGTAPDLDDTTG